MNILSTIFIIIFNLNSRKYYCLHHSQFDIFPLTPLGRFKFHLLEYFYLLKRLMDFS